MSMSTEAAWQTTCSPRLQVLAKCWSQGMLLEVLPTCHLLGMVAWVMSLRLGWTQEPEAVELEARRIPCKMVQELRARPLPEKAVMLAARHSVVVTMASGHSAHLQAGVRMHLMFFAAARHLKSHLLSEAVAIRRLFTCLLHKVKGEAASQAPLRPSATPW
mmetsp:Transcript_158883/g.509514  ORF Transcript_158883/g.509514 Transcript_158883/m.509514 type:complete len:161 (+) Transcript_158883:2407-2889(+)